MKRLALTTLGVAALAAAAAARADIDGFADAGASVAIGTLSAAPAPAADTTDPVFAARAVNDGAVTTPVAAPGAFSLTALAGRAAGVAFATVSGSAQTLRPGAGGAPVAIDGRADAEADRSAGTLRLAATTTSARVPAESLGRPVEQQAGSYTRAMAMIGQSFDVFVDASRPVAPTITLTLKVNGTMASGAEFGWTNGVRASLLLGNVQAPLGTILETHRDFEGALTADTLTLSAPVANLQCPPGRALCDTFVGVRATIELYARDETGNSLEGRFGGLFGGNTQLDFWHTASMTVTSSDGSVLRRLERDDSFAWVNPAAPVPEPAGALMLAAGLAAVGLRARRRR